MTILQSTPEAFVWVGIDVAKDRHEALIEAPGWRSRKRIRVQNAAEDFRCFAEFLHSLGFPVRIGFEPTSNYHRALAYFLHSEGFELQLISSLALARTPRSHAQLLGQERSQRRAGHPYVAAAAKIAHAAYALIRSRADYRCFPEVAVPSGRTRSARAVEAMPTS